MSDDDLEEEGDLEEEDLDEEALEDEDALEDDFVDDDADSFVTRLYETLRADLAKYEVENKG